MEIVDVINKNAIDLQLKVDDKKGALDALAELLYKDGAISSKELFIRDVYAREAEGKTGIGDFIAIPHGKSDSVLRTCIAIGKVAQGIAWETIDGQPVKLIILFAVDNKNKTSEYVKLMAKVAGTLANEKTCACLLKAEKPEEILAVFNDKSIC